MNCPKCGAEIETLVVNVRDGSEGCWPCIAGPVRLGSLRATRKTKGIMSSPRADIWIIDY